MEPQIGQSANDGVSKPAERPRSRVRLGRRMTRLVLAALTALAVGTTAQIESGAPPTGAASSIETTYHGQGPWATSTGSATVDGGTYALYYPTNLGAAGFKHPILTWGNGTGAMTSTYDDTLTHLASWGFVVIASSSGQTGLGTEMLAGATYMVSENGNPSSIFYQKLNVAKVGALGHSQGAGGTLNATVNSNGLITSAVTIELPDPMWWTTPVPDMGNMHAAILFIRGTSDFIATEPAAQNWFNPVPGAAVKAARIGNGHLDIQSPGNNLQGYITAWMMFTLQGDTVARGAFAGSSPEINTNTSWQDQDEKNLSVPPSVGGIAEAPDRSGSPLTTSAGSSHNLDISVAGIAVGALLVVTAGARRWRSRRATRR